jgi:RNA polymerase primary sigma factor
MARSGGIRGERNSTVSECSALLRYLHEIENIPVLTVPEERALATRASRGDAAAQKELVRRNLRFVVSVARQYSRYGVPLEDLINEGNIGLMRATMRFDPNRGFRLISYAVWWIRQSILSYLTDQSRLVRIPAAKVHDLSRLARETEHLQQRCVAAPSVETLARRLGLTVTQVEVLQNLPLQHFSIDEPAEGEESEFEADTLQDPNVSTEEWLQETLLTEDVESALGMLDEREADILRRYFGLGRREAESLQSIGADYGVTRERVRQLRDRALWKLRTSQHAAMLAEYAS